MKRLLIFVLICTLLFAGCSKKNEQGGDASLPGAGEEQGGDLPDTDIPEADVPEAPDSPSSDDTVQQPDDLPVLGDDTSTPGGSTTAPPVVKPGTKPEAKPEAKPDTKPSTKPETKPDTKPQQPAPDTKPEEKLTAAQVSDKLKAKYPMDGMMTLDEAMVKELYGVDLSKAESYSAEIPAASTQASELVVFKIKSASDSAEFEKALKTRRDTLAKSFEGYLQDQCDMANDGKITSKNNYVLLAVGADAEAIAKLFAEIV